MVYSIVEYEEIIETPKKGTKKVVKKKRPVKKVNVSVSAQVHCILLVSENKSKTL